MKRTGILTIALQAVLLCFTAANSMAAGEYDPIGSGLRVLWGMLVVLGVMFVLYALLRKRLTGFQQQNRGIINIIESRQVQPKKSVMLIEVRGKEYLVGCGSDTINSIVPLHGGGTFSSMLEDSEEKLQS